MTIDPNNNFFSLGRTILWQYDKAERLQKMIYHFSPQPCLSFELTCGSADFQRDIDVRFLVSGEMNHVVNVYWSDEEVEKVKLEQRDVPVEVSKRITMTGRKVIRVEGDIHSFRFGGSGLGHDEVDDTRDYLTRVFYFPDSVTSVSRCVESCRNLTYFPFDCLHSGIENVEYAFYGCKSLTGNVPAWPSSCTRFCHAFGGCVSLSGCDVSRTDTEGLMPRRAVSTEGCFSGASELVRSCFFGLWGGGRRFDSIGASGFWDREDRKADDATSFVLYTPFGSREFGVVGVIKDAGGTVSVDWGDGGPVSEYSGHSAMTLQHDYASEGSYLVKVIGASSFGVGRSSRVEQYSGAKLSVVQIRRWSDTLDDATAAFRNCTNLLSSNLPDWGAAMTVARETFMNCKSITSRRIPAWNSGMTDIARCYSGCTSLGLYIGEIMIRQQVLSNSDVLSIFVDAINGIIVNYGLNTAKLVQRSSLYGCVDAFNSVKYELVDRFPAVADIPYVKYDMSPYEFADVYNRLTFEIEKNGG